MHLHALQSNVCSCHVLSTPRVSSVKLVWSASANAFVPSSPMLFPVIHQQHIHSNHEIWKRRVLSVVSMPFLICSPTPTNRVGRTCTRNQQFYASRTGENKRLKGVVSLECLGQRLCTFDSNFIHCHTSATHQFQS